MKPLQRWICLWGAISSTLEVKMTLSAVLSTRLWRSFAESMSRGKYCYFIVEKG